MLKKYKILICDDEREIRDLLKLYLRGEDAEIFEAGDGIRAMEILKKEDVDLALVDIMMPGMDGLELIGRMRREGIKTSFLVISARTALDDRLVGYEAGADDYICKPFEPLEVLAKIRAVLRKGGDEQEILKGRDFVLDLAKCEVLKDGEVSELTKVEFEVLKLMLENPGRVFTKEQIYRAGWGDEYVADDNSIRVIISRLRSKIGPENIQTIRGLGYRLKQ